VSDLSLTLIIIGAATLVLPFCDRRDNRVRSVLFAVGTLLTFRYIVWRFAETLPPFELSLESLYPWTFAVFEAIAAMGATIGFVTFSRTLDRKAEATRYREWLDRLPCVPRVDVLICTYNEEERILTRTIVGALGIDFPGMRVWVLDDGRRQWLKKLSCGLGAGYLTRPDNRHAKGGNINHALEFLRNGPDAPEFVVILDADFVPQRNFLWRTMPLFHADDVGLVQTPQHFFNNDPIQSNLLIGHVWPDEQRFFFDHVMPCKDAWNAAFCCGTSSVIRVQALEEVGGFATHSVTEDFLVTLELDRKGWRTVYLNERLSSGLAPEGMREYLTQRGRWCLGLMQIVRSPFGPFSRGHLSLSYRIGLIDTFFFWAISYAFKLLGLFVPIVYWLIGLSVVQASLDGVVQYFLPYYVSVMIAYGWTTGGLISPVLTDVSHALTMFEVLRATIIGLFKPQGHPFKVTAKGGNRERRLVCWPMVLRFSVVIGLTVIGMLYGTLSDFAASHARFDAKIINLGWSIYNIIVLVIATSVCVELPRYRREKRFPSSEPVRIRAGDRVSTAMLADLSISGARISAPQPGTLGSEVTLTLQEVGDISARIVGGSSQMFVVDFDAGDEARDALIRKLFSGRYDRRPREVHWGGLLGALFARAVR